MVVGLIVCLYQGFCIILLSKEIVAWSPCECFTHCKYTLGEIYLDTYSLKKDYVKGIILSQSVHFLQTSNALCNCKINSL